jgi:hypothetical protein
MGMELPGGPSRTGRRACPPCLARRARRALLGGLVYLIAIAVAFLSPKVSFAIDAIVAVYFAASRSRVPGLIVRSAHADDSS